MDMLMALLFKAKLQKEAASFNKTASLTRAGHTSSGAIRGKGKGKETLPSRMSWIGV